MEPPVSPAAPTSRTLVRDMVGRVDGGEVQRIRVRNGKMRMVEGRCWMVVEEAGRGSWRRERERERVVGRKKKGKDGASRNPQ